MDKTPYEICFWIKDDNTDVVPVGVLDRMKQAILKLEGEVVSERLPEKRLLAYPIEKQRTAFWTELAFNLAPEKLAGLKEELKYEDKILRKIILARIIRKAKPKKISLEQKTQPARPRPIATEEEVKEIEAQLDSKLKEILES